MNTILTDNELQRCAPSIFATEPWHERTARYNFVPTITVINALRDSGYYPIKAVQSGSRIEGKKEYTKHMIRFRAGNDQDIRVNDIIPEIVLINSHDGTKAYNMMLGLFRLVCSNGLVVADKLIDSISVRHIGSRDLCQDVIDVSARIIQDAPRTLERVQQWEKINLYQPQQIDFARRAIALNDSSVEVEPQRLLSARRGADFGRPDGSRSLWTTYNVIQENLLKGRVLGRDSNGYYRRTREIKAIDKNVKINRGLWALAETYAGTQDRPLSEFEKVQQLINRYGHDWASHIREAGLN